MIGFCFHAKGDMKKKNFLKLLSMLLVLVLTLGLFAGCGGKDDTDKPEETKGETQETTSGDNKGESTSSDKETKSITPLVAGYSPFSEKFSPFFADTGYDQDASALTQLQLLTTDRTGGIIYNAIEGETVSYNNTDYLYTGIANVAVNYDEATDLTVYKWTIRDDIKFSDGEAMDADDIIFSYYVYSDPSYDGSNTLYSVPILGMQDYRTQTSSEVYDKYNSMFDEIYEAGEDYAPTGADAFSKEQADSLWATVEKQWKNDLQAIVNTCAANYSAYYESVIGIPADEVLADEGLTVAGGMGLWGFASVDENRVLTTAHSGAVFDMANGEYPSIDDFYADAVAAYGTLSEYVAADESPQDVSPLKIAKDEFIATEGPKDPAMGGESVPNIKGIKKLSDTEVEITVQGFDAPAIYQLGVEVAPLHYYGDIDLYDYDNNMFGFPFGDLSIIKAKTTQPMGAGPYRLIKYENKVIYYEANEHYYKGEPKTYYLQFKESTDADKISGVSTGTIDVTDPSFGNAAVEEIKSYNSNGEVTGDVITTNTVDNLGYGYIGINADNVLVGDDKGSEASKNLRRAFATILAVYRDLSIDSYYGERASIINYPISNTSWAAPQKSDEGYEMAFSKNMEGESIYTADMNAETKYEVALEAAKGYLTAAGYSYDEGAGLFTAAPAGAKLSYEIVVPGDGAGNHPSFIIATMFKEAMESIGFTIELNDPANSDILWDKLDANTHELWCAAWGATIDPDMYQVYHSDNSTNSNHYHIADAEMDQLIIDARKSDDQAYRKATYKACLDIIIDWAVEVPIYQRQNCIIFSSERVNLDTVTPDITTYWGWMHDIELLEMND